ncbi:hypothetical protein Bca101_076132 [Brassica carinata]
MGSKFGIGSLSIVMTLLLSLVPKLEAEFTTVEQAIKSDGSISFLVIGDWGRRGLYNQSQVALQMGKIGEKMDIDFVVSTGDNIYDNGMKSIDDPAFQLSFANIYISPSLQKPWYLVLGNHDYRGDVEAQLSPALRSIDSRWICMRSFIVDAEIAELFFVDTTPFVDAYFLNPEGQNYDWRGVSPRESYLQTTLKDLETSLRESTAKWKIVVGHHAIKSASIHGNTKELESLLLPILEANNVDLYVNGHDHCLQHISTSQSPIQFLTSGGGSKAWRGYYNWKTPEDMKFFYDGQGKIVRSPFGVMHGKSSMVYYDDKGEEGLFSGLSNPFLVGRYHSLVIEKDSFPSDELEVTAAWTGDGLVMAARHRKHKHIQGVQFHPESIIATEGKTIVRNFIKLVEKKEAEMLP